MHNQPNIRFDLLVAPLVELQRQRLERMQKRAKEEYMSDHLHDIRLAGQSHKTSSTAPILAVFMILVSNS